MRYVSWACTAAYVVAMLALVDLYGAVAFVLGGVVMFASVVGSAADRHLAERKR